MYKIGIDLSTTNTGIVVLNQDNNLIEKYILSFRTFSELNYQYNFALIDSVCNELSNYLMKDSCIVGIELANFSKALLTNRFSLYAGAFIDNIVKYNDVEVKCFNANQWQKFVGINIGSDTRETTKLKARQFTKEKCMEYNEGWSEDLCDAYCIAYNLENVKSNEQKSIEVKQRKYKYIQEIQKKHKINKSIECRLNKIQTLDNVRNRKQIERLQKEIVRLKNEI